ncbi:MAG: BrnA antitoxin family protein [Anaerolineae bacterium]|nr:BrnA antitoxin family protein [Anaerolineae bacterium]
MKDEYNFSEGRRGAVLPQIGKTRITIYLDNDVLEAFRTHAENTGSGYQTLINRALREYLERFNGMTDETMLRRVVREELERVMHSEPTSA